MRKVLNQEVQDLLWDAGGIRRTIASREVLGCIACRWDNQIERGNESKVCGSEIMKCTGLKPATVYPILRKLEKYGAVVKIVDMESGNLGRNPAFIYPAETELGELFFNNVEAPDECFFDDGQI